MGFPFLVWRKIMYPFLEIFNLKIPMYAIMIMVGFLFAFLVFNLLIKEELKTVDKILFSIYVFLGGLVGAKILAMIVAIPYFFNASFNFFKWGMNSGMVYFGGVLGAFLMGELYIKLYGLKPEKIWDKVIAVLPLGQVFGRIGCFCAGCCYGVESEKLGLVFPYITNKNLEGVKLLPTQLIEASFCLIVFVFLIILSKKTTKEYLILLVYSISYGVFRFMIEFFRGDETRGIFILSTSQWIAILLIAFGFVLYFTNLKKTKFFKETPPLIKQTKN